MSSAHAMTVAFIGIGHMGFAMAGRLASAGFEVVVYDTDPRAMAAFTAQHAALAATSAIDAAEGANVVIFMLPNVGLVRQTLFEQKLAGHLAGGTVVVDMGTAPPHESAQIAVALSGLGIAYLDAPVMGGVIFARDGTLEVMVSGPHEQVDRCRPLFAAMGHKIWACGDAVGNAGMLKIVTNYINAAALINTAEAMVLGRKFGLDTDLMAQAIDTMCNGRQHPIVKKIIPHVLTRKYATGMSLKLIAKDVGIAAHIGQELDAAVPLTELTARMWHDIAGVLGGDRDQSEIVRYWEDAAGITL